MKIEEYIELGITEGWIKKKRSDYVVNNKIAKIILKNRDANKDDIERYTELCMAIREVTNNQQHYSKEGCNILKKTVKEINFDKLKELIVYYYENNPVYAKGLLNLLKEELWRTIIIEHKKNFRI